MKEFITKNFQFLIIIALFGVLMLQRCGGDGNKFDPVIKRDTVVSVIHHFYQDTTNSQPKIIVNIPPTKQDIPIIMLPDSNYSSLLKQYDSLLTIHYSKNIQQDSLKIDTFGYVKTLDTVYDNKIIGRKWTTNLKIPEKTNTITITQTLPPKTQVYIGLSLSGNQETPINGAGVGGLLKNRREQIYGVKASLMNKVGIVYEIQTYWNLKKLFK